MPFLSLVLVFPGRFSVLLGQANDIVRAHGLNLLEVILKGEFPVANWSENIVDAVPFGLEVDRSGRVVPSGFLLNRVDHSQVSFVLLHRYILLKAHVLLL